MEHTHKPNYTHYTMSPLSEQTQVSRKYKFTSVIYSASNI